MAGLYDYNSNEKVITRSLRTLKIGIKLVYNYKFRFNPETAMEIHETTAKDILELCHENGGLYVKLGQALTTFDHMLPPP